MTVSPPPSFDLDPPRDRDVALVTRAVKQAWARMKSDAHDGLCDDEISRLSRWHLNELVRRMAAGVLTPAEAALEVMRTELAARDTAPLPAMPAALTESSDG